MFSMPAFAIFWHFKGWQHYLQDRREVFRQGHDTTTVIHVGGALVRAQPSATQLPLQRGAHTNHHL